MHGRASGRQNYMPGQSPLIFYTNGLEIHLWDDAAGYPAMVHGFYSKDELQLAINRRTLRQSLANMHGQQVANRRYYQTEATTAVAEQLQGKTRGGLLVMATGTGKTITAIALVDLLT